MSVIRRSFALSAASKYTKFLLVFGSNVVIARLLTPEEIGVYGVAAVLAGIAQIFRDMGIGQYLIREPEINVSKLRVAFTLMSTMAWSLGAGLVFASSWVAELYAEPTLQSVLRIQAIAFFIVPFGAISLTLLKREFRFGAVYFVEVAANVAQPAVAISLALLGFGSESLAWASVASVLVTSLGAVIARRDRFAFSPSFRGAKAVLGFGGYVTVTQLLGTLNRDIPELLISKWMGMPALAFFSKAMLPSTIFSQFVMGALNPVLLPAYSKKHHEADVEQPFLYGVACLSALVVPGLVLISLLADWVIMVMFGGQWGPAVDPMRIFAIATAVGAVTATLSPLLVAMGHPQAPMKVQLIVVPIRVALVAAAIPYGLLGVAFAWLVSGILGAMLQVYMLRRIVGIRWRELLRAVFPALGFGCPIAGAVGAAIWWVAPPITVASGLLVLAVAGTCFLALWWLVLASIAHPLHQELMMFVGWTRRADSSSKA